MSKLMSLLLAAVADGIVNGPFRAVERGWAGELIHVRPTDEFTTGHAFSATGTAARGTRSTAEGVRHDARRRRKHRVGGLEDRRQVVDPMAAPSATCHLADVERVTAGAGLDSWTSPPSLTSTSVNLRGRDRECQTLDELVAEARSGSKVVVLRGEAGVGKSALLDHAAACADGFRIVRVAGVESDLELAFAGLQQLCAPLLGHLDELPQPQRTALDVAFGRGVGNTPDRFLVGLAVLSLVAAAAAEQPLVCIVDEHRCES